MRIQHSAAGAAKYGASSWGGGNTILDGLVVSNSAWGSAIWGGVSWGGLIIFGRSTTVIRGQVRISRNESDAISGQTHIRIAVDEDISGIVDINNDMEATIQGLIRILGSAYDEIEGVVNVRNAVDADIAGVVSIATPRTYGIDGQVDIIKPLENALDGIVRVQRAFDTSLDGQVRIYTTSPRKLPQNWEYDDLPKAQTWEGQEKTSTSWSDDTGKEPATWKYIDYPRKPRNKDEISGQVRISPPTVDILGAVSIAVPVEETIEGAITISDII